MQKFIKINSLALKKLIKKRKLFKLHNNKENKYVI